VNLFNEANIPSDEPPMEPTAAEAPAPPTPVFAPGENETV